MEDKNKSSKLLIENTHFCPVCKMETCIPALNITFEEYIGDYCMKCFAKFISENIPKLKKINK